MDHPNITMSTETETEPYNGNDNHTYLMGQIGHLEDFKCMLYREDHFSYGLNIEQFLKFCKD